MLTPVRTIQEVGNLSHYIILIMNKLQSKGSRTLPAEVRFGTSGTIIN